MSNPEAKLRILIVGHSDPTRLEQSYARAFEQLGHTTSTYPIHEGLVRYKHFGAFAKRFQRMAPLPSWETKANRDFILASMKMKPDVICLFIPEALRAGALAQLRCALASKIVMIWPDPLLNLSDRLIQLLPLTNIFASYSQTTLQWLTRLGATKPFWLPLAADPELHPRVSLTSEDRDIYGATVSFVGHWRPEREAALSFLTRNAPDLRIRIWGHQWERVQDPTVQKVLTGKGATGVEFSKIALATSINLNIIDPMNDTAANMRFFELPCAGGLQLSTYCDQMADQFQHGRELYYFHSHAEMLSLIRTLLGSTAERAQVAEAGHRAVMAAHTYKHRAKALLDALYP